MKCDICRERQAVVFIHQVGSEGPTELHLCEECAKSHGLVHLSEDVGKALMELLKNFPQTVRNSRGKKGTGNEFCPFCGTTWRDLQKSQRAGCARCYAIFKNLLKKEIISYGKEGGYKGRLSVSLRNQQNRQSELERLRKLLQEALEKERYEEAAQYRDAIQQLEQGA
ncbi:UvrB/UvrC motif-containing protein [Treponema sp. J25]|uniref:UvrB/UvrC motif-containing protein n=1 Tax=Treponema sp. J25 TaxID=2094121 RepID=UPI00105066DA|nr:UvrB/UvrC motif-containing protein [Treponema sp. J25]TCW62229.1 hypothetical protein C5O22_01800 [Treponema sp. J25]